jgi:hypothetical protein
MSHLAAVTTALRVHLHALGVCYVQRRVLGNAERPRQLGVLRLEARDLCFELGTLLFSLDLALVRADGLHLDLDVFARCTNYLLQVRLVLRVLRFVHLVALSHIFVARLAVLIASFGLARLVLQLLSFLLDDLIDRQYEAFT